MFYPEIFAIEQFLVSLEKNEQKWTSDFFHIYLVHFIVIVIVSGSISPTLLRKAQMRR